MPEFLLFLQGLKLSLFAVDESHCISEDGDTISAPRVPPVKAIKRRDSPSVPVMALTATATPVVQGDIITQLKLSDCEVFKASFNRKNLYYQIETKSKSISSTTPISGCPKRRIPELSIVRAAKPWKALLRAYKQKDTVHCRTMRVLRLKARTENQERFIREDVEIIRGNDCLWYGY